MDAVVFDTNVYQGLSVPRLAALVPAEVEHGIRGFADSWVMIELLSKLVSEKQRPYARAALRKLWSHCGQDELRFVVDCEEQVCRILLGRPPEGHDAVRDRLGLLCAQVATHDKAASDPEVLRAAAELLDHLQTVEAERAELVFDGIVRTIVPDAESWDAVASRPELRETLARWIDGGHAVRVLAESEVRRAYADLGLPIPDPVPQQNIDLILEHFSYPLEVESASIRAVLQEGADLTKHGRQNAIWDAQIAFNAGQPMEGGGTILLVTNDRLLLDVAAAVGHAGVVSMDEYLAARGVAA